MSRLPRYGRTMDRRDRGALLALLAMIASILFVQYLQYLPLLQPEAHKATFAEWLGTLTGGLSLLVATWAAFLLFGTLQETRRIGRAQTRAYLIVEGGSIEVGERAIFYRFRVKNVGQSPALRVRVRLDVTLPAPRRSDVSFKAITSTRPAIAAGSAEESTHWFNNAAMPAFTGTTGPFPELPEEIFATVLSGERRHTFIWCTLAWVDVFGTEQHQSFSLTELTGDASPQSSALRRVELAPGQTWNYNDDVRPT
jgi:hypothetical protein